MPKTTTAYMDKLSTDKVLKNFNKAIKKLKEKSQEGLIEAGLFIKAKAGPVTPIKYGNLRASAFVTWAGATVPAPSFINDKDGKLNANHLSAVTEAKSKGLSFRNDPWVAVGYSAYYAVYVHEINKHYNEGHWKFLSSTIYNNKNQLLRIIAKRAKI